MVRTVSESMHESERNLAPLSIDNSLDTDDESMTVSESGRVGCVTDAPTSVLLSSELVDAVSDDDEEDANDDDEGEEEDVAVDAAVAEAVTTARRRPS